MPLNIERIRRERNAVSEAAAEEQRKAGRKMTELQNEIEKLKAKAEAAHNRAESSNRTSAAYRNAHAAEVTLKQQIEDEYDDLHAAQRKLSEQKAASNRELARIQGLLRSKNTALQTAQNAASRNLARSKAVGQWKLGAKAAVANVKTNRANAAALRARQNAAAARAEANAARAAIRGATNFAAQKIAEERAKVAEATERATAASAAVAAANAKLAAAEASGRNVGAARNAAAKEAAKLKSQLNFAKSLAKSSLNAATKAANAARATANKHKAEAARSGSAEAAALAKSNAHAAEAAQARAAETRARAERIEALKALANARGNVNKERAALQAANTAAKREANAKNAALAAERAAHVRTKGNRAALLVQKNAATRAATQARNNAAASNARAQAAQRELNAAKAQLTNSKTESERVAAQLRTNIASARLKHEELERQRNTARTLLSKAAEAEAIAKLNAEGSKAGKNASEKAHTETEKARQELSNLLNLQRRLTSTAVSAARNNAARRNAAAEAAAVNAALKLTQKELELSVARGTAKGIQQAKNAVNAALVAEKKARVNATATHAGHIAQLSEQSTANKAAAQLATQRANQAEAIARQRADEAAVANKGRANKAVANKAAANLAIEQAEFRREAANARAREANARANAAEKAARESKSAANQAVANRARANANRAAANARSAALAATTAHLTGVITGAIKNKIPGNNMNLNVSATGGAGGAGGNSRATGGAGGSINFKPTITVSGGGNTAAILAQFMKAAPPSMNSELLQHIKNALKNKGGSNLTGSNKKELMDQLVMLMEEREQLMAKTNNASKTRLAVVEIKIKTTKQLLKALGITIANNNIKPVIPKNNLNQALSITNRFSRLQKLYDLFRQTKDTARKMRLAREIRLVIAKMYGSNVSTSNAIRNITNAGRLVGRGAVSKNVNRNLETAMKILKNEAKSGGKRSGLRPSGSSSYVPRGAYGSYGGMNLPRGGVNMGRTAGAAPPISISISNIGKVSNAGKTQVSNVGKMSNSGTTGRLAVSAPTTNGSRQLAATSEQLIRGAGGAEAVEQGIKALNAANGNVTRAKAASRLPNNTFTNIYAMGGPVAAKRLVESRRRRRTVGTGTRGGLRVASKKKRVAHKPRKQYIKLTPYQFKRLTDHIKKNNLRKVLIKEITH